MDRTLHFEFQPTSHLSTLLLVETFEFGIKQAFEKHFGPRAVVEKILYPSPAVVVSLPEPEGTDKEIALAKRQIELLRHQVGNIYTSILGTFHEVHLRN